jgi:hypothetical protein
VLFDTLEVPESLLIAQEEGRLVVFAGAGVSMGPPARLPSFGRLTEMIAVRRLSPREKRQLDQVLGRIATEGVNVHAEIARVLGRDDSLPTTLHGDLLGLFPAREQVRLVTTNFDPHFRTEAARLFPGLPVFTAPAVPRGGDFHGVVELHGCLQGTVADLVVTDRDFGRAYLTEGWARMFVEQMFARYTVLFVGYSLTDPPLHYFSRGLPTEAVPRRYVITNEAPARWNMLGVDVIPFRARRGQRTFVPLYRGVAAWRQITRGSPFQLEERIVTLLARPDPNSLSPAEGELLRWSLGQDHTVQYFTRNARGLAWAEWLAERGLLKPYFDPRTDALARQRSVAAWLATELTASREEKERALGIVRAQGGRLSRDLAFWLRHRMNEASEEWTLLVATQIEANDQDGLWALGQRVRDFANQDSPMFWSLWTILTTPEIELDPVGLEPGDFATMRVALKGLAGDLWSSWSEVVRPRLDRLGAPMLEHLLRQWDRATELAQGVGAIESLHRTATDSRTRIAPRDYYHHRNRQPTVLVDMLVSVIGYLARQNGGLPRNQIEAWLGQPDSVIRRLGLHAVSLSTEMLADEKIDHVQRCLAAYPAGTLEHREALALLRELTEPTESLVASPSVPAATEESLPSFDGLLALDAPGLNRTLNRVRVTPAVALSLLQELAPATAANAALETHPLWPCLLFRLEWRGLDRAGRDQVLALVATNRLEERYPEAVLRMLFHGDPLDATGEQAATPVQADTLFAITRKVWNRLASGRGTDEPTDYAATDWVSLALSHGIYHLVQFWLRYLSLQPVNPAAPALPSALAEIFEDIATRDSGVGRRARAVLLQDLGFLIVRDPVWTKRYLVPLFDFAQHGQNAWIAWRPFLEHGRLNRQAAIALTPAYRTARDTILAAGEKLVGDYLQDAATIMVRVLAPEIAGWPEELFAVLGETERLRWGRLVGRELAGLTDGQQIKLWETWLGAFWEQRSRGRIGSRTMAWTGREPALMADWLTRLPAVFPQAFALLRMASAVDFQEERIDWRDLRQSELPVRHPVEFLAFVEFLLANMQDVRVHQESIQQAVGRLPRLPVFRASLLRLADVFQRQGWTQARAFKTWAEEQFPAG